MRCSGKHNYIAPGKNRCSKNINALEDNFPRTRTSPLADSVVFVF